MAGIRNKIVVAQKIWSTDAYIAYYDNGDAVMYNGLDDDELLQKFVQECTTAGCSKVVEFPIQVNAQSQVKCRQTLYCKSLVIGGNTSVADTATGIINSITNGGINYVLWCPTFERITIHEGLLNTGRPVSLNDLHKAPKSVIDFMQHCVKDGYSLKRLYRTTVSNRVVTVVEYLFSEKKLPKDFKGSDVDQIEVEELEDLGFKI